MHLHYSPNLRRLRPKNSGLLDRFWVGKPSPLGFLKAWAHIDPAKFRSPSRIHGALTLIYRIIRFYRICKFASQMKSLKMSKNDIGRSQLEPAGRPKDGSFGGDSCENHTERRPATAPTGSPAGPSNHLQVLQPTSETHTLGGEWKRLRFKILEN